MVVFVFVMLDFNGLLGQYSNPFILKFLVTKASFPQGTRRHGLKNVMCFVMYSLLTKATQFQVS